MKTKIDFIEQQIIVNSYIVHNCSASEKMNYKKTSHLWSFEISKWAGVEITIQAFDKVCKKFNIKTVEISKGVNVYGLETMKKYSK